MYISAYLGGIVKRSVTYLLCTYCVLQSTKAHIEEIRSDAESLKKMKQQQKQQSKVCMCVGVLIEIITTLPIHLADHTYVAV